MTNRQQLLALYRACFPEDPPAFWEWIFDRVYRPENTLNIRENNRIIASLQMIPCTMRYEGHDYPAHYIYAASTLPQRQGRGLMADLLKQAAERGRQKGHVFSVLITQEDSLLGYYDRFGYEDRFVIGLQQPSYMALELGQNCRRAVEEDIAAMNAIFERETCGMLHGARFAEDWLLQLELFGDGAQVLEQNGSVTAYAFSDERGIMEAAGSAAAVLAAQVCPGQKWRSIPQKGGTPMGSIKPLRDDIRPLMEQNRCYLNLMFN